MTEADRLIVQADLKERADLRSIMAAVTGAMDDAEARATGTFDELDAPERREDWRAA